MVSYSEEKRKLSDQINLDTEKYLAKGGKIVECDHTSNRNPDFRPGHMVGKDGNLVSI
jgi:hypothetical protein